MTTPEPQPTFIEAILDRLHRAEIVRESLAAHVHSLERTMLHDVAERVAGDPVLNRFIETAVRLRQAGVPDGAFRAAGAVLAARLDEVTAHTGPQAAQDAQGATETAETSASAPGDGSEGGNGSTALPGPQGDTAVQPQARA